MAEAHAAVAFSFAVTDDGLDVNVNQEALRAVWASGIRSWRKRIVAFKNRFLNGVYPATPTGWLVISSVVSGLYLAKYDPSLGLIEWISHVPMIQQAAGAEPNNEYAACVIFATGAWLSKAFVMKYTLRGLLQYHRWMFEPRGKTSITTKLWVGMIKLIQTRNPLLYAYQDILPKLPVPALADTMKRYLRSVRPFLDDEKYNRMERLVVEFKKGIGYKLQRYLVLKSWWASNYVSDWWEEYVYLRGRSPIMVNSNFYGLDAIFRQPTTIQAARAANIVHGMLSFRSLAHKEKLPPIMLNGTVPLCSWQYDRQFNTTRLPGIETDRLMHLYDSTFIAVYHKGRYYKTYIYYKGVLMSPIQIETMLQKIMDDDSAPAVGEEKLAALTAGDRVPWAKARSQFFNKGINKTSLDCIEKSAFCLTLDEDPQCYDQNDSSKLDKFGRAMLHGKCYDRWFDKSFTLVVTSNGKIGFNGEHSWADAPIMGHLWEFAMAEDHTRGYKEDGHCTGEAEFTPPNPIRLQWDIPKECLDVIENSLTVAQSLADDVDLHLMIYTHYGKGFMKKCKMSPDAYLQMALQLSYFRDAGSFCLTYEASMTRLFREGRTETVRSCTIESAAFCKAMEDKTKTKEDRISLLNKAATQHQSGYRLAMTGDGIDRHLFCLYVVSRYLNIDSPFLKEVLSEPWRLSTSQTPHQQTDKIDLAKNPDLISAGGGFGPVADDGYGVSYIVAGEDTIAFHISSKVSAPCTNSTRFGETICTALQDMKELFS